MTNQTLTTDQDQTDKFVDHERHQEPVVVPQRLNLARHAGPAYKAMLNFSETVTGLGLEASLMALIEIRASQINGCAYCIDMHTVDAAAAGETHQRMHALNAWRETPFFTARERAALTLTEEVTRLDNGVSDEAFDVAAEQFDEAELTALTWWIAVINSWNRIAITARATPGQHLPVRTA